MKEYKNSENINDKTENKSAKDIMTAATNILVFADNTEKSLRDKLSNRGFDKETIDSAVVKLKEAGLINDARLIRSYTEYLADKKLYGRGRIKLELQRKGFDRELISESFEDCVSDVDFEENCVKLIRKKNLVKKIRDSKTAQKVNAALARYGYGYAEIKYAYTRLLEENEEE